MMIKYLLCSGYIQSVNDGQIHFISARSLQVLYQVSMNECIIRSTPAGNFRNHELIELWPCWNGDYTLPFHQLKAELI